MSIQVGIAVLVILATTTMAITTIPALADKSSGSNGLEKADQNVHTNTPGGFGGHQDLNFHVGTCNGGHTTAALNSIGGCAILPSPSQCHAQKVGPCASLP